MKTPQFKVFLALLTGLRDREVIRIFVQNVEICSQFIKAVWNFLALQFSYLKFLFFGLFTIHLVSNKVKYRKKVFSVESYNVLHMLNLIV